ncbi:hypothetical protein LINPERPRIM_LOCUS24930 [Linum perenne]
MFTKKGIFGAEMALRDARGELVSFRMVRRSRNQTPNECEALALVQALTWLHGMDVTHVIVETDALEVH